MAAATPHLAPSFRHLEERPQKSVLSHDFGAGSPCLTCTRCPGLEQHFWRKICKSCGCKVTDHDLPIVDPSSCDVVVCSLFGPGHRYHTEAIRLPETIPGRTDYLKRAAREWASSTATEADTESNASVSEMSRLSLQQEERSIGYSSESSTGRAVLQPTDNNNEGEDDRERVVFEQFITETKDRHFGVGQALEYDSQVTRSRTHRTAPFPTATSGSGETTHAACAGCGNHFRQGDQAVLTSHGSPESLFHRGCFKCQKCEDLLSELLYFFKDGTYLCGRHFGDAHYPRCSGCDELILCNQYTEADGLAWHNNHFCCSRCDISLGGLKYVAIEGRQLCFTCHIKEYSNVCNTCKQLIMPDEPRLAHKNLFWHNKDECFRCATCNSTLVSRKFVLKNETIFCSMSCKNEKIPNK